MILPRPYRPALWPLLGLLLLLAPGCSQQKDAFLNRTFHRLTARDNGWFNANEKLHEVIRSIEDNYQDDFDHVLPLFVYGTEDQARSAIPDLENCIEKCSLVIERHSMDIGGEEKNKWIDDAWFVIGKSHFYKANYYEADRVFGYIARRYKGEDRQWDSELWQARTAIQLEQYAKAQSSLDKIRHVKKLPKHFDHAELSAVQADLDLKRNKLDAAIMNLEHAVSNTKRKRERVRWTFVLAQLYEQKGDQENAIKSYTAVTRMSPPYELAFHAQIFQAFAFSRGNSKVLRQKLERMLRDEKHVDHFDMIHYALADLDLKERDKPGAIDHLETSALVSTTDTKQKTKTWLKLADIYFDDRLYANAQRYYDSTRTLMPEEHERFREVDTRAEVLGELVEQLHIIALEDSLQMLAQLDEKELEKRIRIMIREREREEEDRERMEAEARDRTEQPAARAAPTAPGGGAGGRGAWYFYDPQQVGRGANQFRKTWGNRKLEDDWRRRDRSGSAMGDFADEPDPEDEAPSKERGSEPWRDPSFYTKDLPRDEASLEASNEKICIALYISGMIYKEQLKDTDNAVESFELLHNRFDECRYTPESYYQLYRIYLEKEQAANYFSPDGSGSQTFANIILDRYPDSEFARLVRDPNILQADEARRHEEEAAYKRSYQDYREYSYAKVIAESQRVILEEPNNHFLPKYHMLRAMAIGGQRDASGFKKALADIKALFPGTDEASAAEELLAILDQGTSQPPPKSTPAGNYKPAQGKHYFALIVPNRGNDMAVIKSKLSDFNNAFTRHSGIEITNNFLDPENQIVLVSFFDSKAKAMEFYTLFKGNQDILTGINDKGYPAFAISPENYSQLYKNKDVDGYTSFFASNYLGGK